MALAEFLGSATAGGSTSTPVSPSSPLPVTGNITASNPSVTATGTADPGFATEVGVLVGGNLVGVSAGNPLPVSGSFSASFSEPVLNVTASATTASVLTGTSNPLTNTQGYRSVAIQATAITSGSTLVFETSNDGTTWVGQQSIGDTVTETSTPMGAVGQYVFNFTALQARIRCSVLGSAGTQSVNMEYRQNPVSPNTAAQLALVNTTLGSPFQAGGSIGNTAFGISGSLPAGTAVIGHVITDSGSTTAVTGNVTVINGGTFATQLTAALPVGANAIGSITNTSFAATQATASALNATVVGTGTFAVQATQAGTWNINNVAGTVSLPTGAATAAKQPALGTAGTPSADVLTVQGAASMTALKVDGSGVTQPVSGTVTANLGTIAGVATQTTLAAIQTALGSPFQAGGSIGNTSFAVTNGGTFLVQNNAATPAGSNLIGKTGIDQTTPGTTNAVQADTAAFQSGTTTTTGATSTSLIAAVTSKRIYVTSLSVWNSSAGTVTVNLQDAVSGTVIWSTIIPAGGGSIMSGPPFCRTTAGNALAFQVSGSATTVGISAAGFAL